MEGFVVPDPILDAREQELLDALTRDYKKFTSPGIISRGASRLGQGIAKIAPKRLQKLATDAVDVASEWELIKQALAHAGKGFVELTKHASRFTLSHDSVVESLNGSGCSLKHFTHICAARSYHVEQHLSKRSYADIGAAFVEGAATGAPGLLGVPFNIALSFLLYFRAVQSTALFYGYDIKGDPRELEFASEATIASLAPNSDAGADTLGGFVGRMMVATNVTVLRQALSKRTYTEMAKRGGSELVYVQIRALANKAAEKALKNAGREGLEAGVFKQLLEQIGQRLPKEAGKKAIPLLGAVVGAFSDTYYMSRVLRGSNLIYHKRFLFEKEHRVGVLTGTNMNL